MRLRPSFGAALACAMVLGATAASATKYTYSVTGVVTDDVYDPYAYYGATLPLDAAFTLTYVVDDAAPTGVYTSGAAGSLAGGGGLYQADTSTPVTASITVGSYSYALRVDEFFQPYSYDPTTGDSFGTEISRSNYGLATKDSAAKTLSFRAEYDSYQVCCGLFFGDSTDYFNNFDISLHSLGFTSADYRELGTFDLAPDSTGYFLTGYFAEDHSGGVSLDYQSAGLLATRLTVTSDVAEPASWVAMMAGFGLLGGMLRRRRSTAHPTYAF
ncbi:PEP-CTERM sorting domain-containing protein [Sphingomonas nostoxanthinifaciens]|uniref:PEP-CTERM sorting domain-containing protein n=1 Tax=Sphingomonas nostoxanthinifaciens TaxID=2872652 RepID=UPI001CC1DF61|nr:PEP-CTERM sorting domain-containing protein [Sphingomonas nostoxanthinifaciens]UAK26386.1 hypothetical protein K8P63_10025 [Sphingomonas nostoxanthinifaciens]